jgi:hypothetical protein
VPRPTLGPVGPLAPARSVERRSGPPGTFKTPQRAMTRSARPASFAPAFRRLADVPDFARPYGMDGIK